MEFKTLNALIVLAWAAGLFEGEGSFSIRKDNPRNKPGVLYRYLRMQLDSTDKDVLERFQKAVGVGHIYGGEVGYVSPSSIGKKPVWKWTCSGSSAWALANTFRPFLGSRRTQRLDAVAVELSPNV